MSVAIDTCAWGLLCSARSLLLHVCHTLVLLVHGIYDGSALGVDFLAGLCKLKACTCIIIYIYIHIRVMQGIQLDSPSLLPSHSPPLSLFPFKSSNTHFANIRRTAMSSLLPSTCTSSGCRSGKMLVGHLLHLSRSH